MYGSALEWSDGMPVYTLDWLHGGGLTPSPIKYQLGYLLYLTASDWPVTGLTGDQPNLMCNKCHAGKNFMIIVL